MITLSASGGSVTFEFSGNSTYLNDGQITVPVNSLALIIDESDMATFRKAASNDIFVSANIAEFGMTKAELESWYKANMVGSTGGGGGVTSGEVQTMIDESISGKADSSAVTEEISAAVSGKVDTEDLEISGKTLYVGDYHSGGMPYEYTKEYPISTKPTKLLVKRTDDGDATNVTAFQLYFDNGTTSGSCILRVSTAVGSGITEAAWNVETPEASLELVNGEVYITFLNGYYLTMFKPGTYIQGFVMQIVTDIESGSTPSVVESEIYNALDKMSETLTDVITKSDAAYYKGIGYPSLSYSSSGITFSSSSVGGGLGVNTATTSVLATDASIGADNGVLGVYTTGATHAVIKNDSVSNNRIYLDSIPSSIKMYWNSSYTGNTSHYIAVSCTVNDDTNGYCQWDWKNDQYVPNRKYVNTAVTLTYDSTNQVVTITPSSSSALTSIIYVRCNRNIAPATALTQDDCRIGAVTIDTNSYKLQEALDNKVDTSAIATSITSGDTNPVAGGAVYDKVHVTSGESSETVLIFEERTVGGTQGMISTNYPSGATIVKLDINNVPSYLGYFGWYGADESFLGGAKITQDGGNIGVDFNYSGVNPISGTASYTDNVLTVEVTGFQNASLSDIAYFFHDLMSTYNSIKAVKTPKEYWIKEYVDAQTSAVTEEISAAVSGKTNQSDFIAYTASTDAALSGKQDTLSAGTGISISGNVISATGGGSLNISISGGSGTYSIQENAGTAQAPYSHAEGFNTMTTLNSDYAHAEGNSTVAGGEASHAEGVHTTTNNLAEHASGQYNASSISSATFGGSGNTLFSVGNGTSTADTHNAFEIRQNGDIYITSGGTDIKLQDHLGGGGGEVSSAITSGDTNAVAGGAVFDAVVYSGNTYNTELTFDANGYAENWVVGQSAITIDVSGYTATTRAIYHFENSNGRDLGTASIGKTIGSWGGAWGNNADNCTITTDGDTATTATITDIPSGTVKIRRIDENNPPKAIISGDTPEIWIKDALDDHRDNTTVHITAAERTSWNNKSNFSGSYNDLTDKPIPDSALNVASTNPVQNQALFSELRIDGEGEAETTLTFEGQYSTNYPNGCTKIKVEGITSMSQNVINFNDDGGHTVGTITVSNWGSISVDTSYFQGATYEISGTTVIISYPTVTTVTRLDVSDSTKYTYKAITSSTTPLKDQVVANTTALGGLKLVKLTQADYAALSPNYDSNTVYFIGDSNGYTMKIGDVSVN